MLNHLLRKNSTFRGKRETVLIRVRRNTRRAAIRYYTWVWLDLWLINYEFLYGSGRGILFGYFRVEKFRTFIKRTQISEKCPNISWTYNCYLCYRGCWRIRFFYFIRMSVWFFARNLWNGIFVGSCNFIVTSWALLAKQIMASYNRLL